MIRPGRDVLHVVEAAHRADAPADQAAEDHEVQRRGDRRGHEVWPQMRMMRPYSRMMMVVKPIQRAAAVRSDGSSALGHVGVPARSPRLVLDQAHEHLLQAIDLVAHAAARRCPAPTSRAKMSLRLCSLDTSTSSVWSSTSAHRVARQAAAPARTGIAQVEHEGLGVQLAQQVAHAVALDDAGRRR